MLLEAARKEIRGSVAALARADLDAGAAALLVAVQGRKAAPVSYVLVILSPDGAGGYTLDGHEEVRAGPVFGAPTVALAAGTLPVAAGALTATVGWKADDGSSDAQAVLFRQAGGRLSRLLAVSATRTFATGSGRPSVRNEIDVLPTASGGFKDLRVRTRECATADECGEPTEVVSYTFDGVRYRPRPHAIPFVEKIEASSVLSSSGALVDHSGAAAIDGRPDTAWCEGAPGAGWFQKLELELIPAQRVKAISILPGGPRGDAPGDWTRPKRIRVLLPGGGKVESELADEPRPQRIELPAEERIFGLTVVVVDVYKGKREDACINELELEVEP